MQKVMLWCEFDNGMSSSGVAGMAPVVFLPLMCPDTIVCLAVAVG